MTEIEGAWMDGMHKSQIKKIEESVFPCPECGRELLPEQICPCGWGQDIEQQEGN